MIKNYFFLLSYDCDGRQMLNEGGSEEEKHYERVAKCRNLQE